MQATENHDRDNSELRRCLNDLIGLTTLPAIWAGGDTREIVIKLLETLLRVLDLNFAYTLLPASSGRDQIELARFAGSEDFSIQAEEMASAIRPWLVEMSASPESTDVPLVNGMRIAIRRLGLGERRGWLALGSLRKNFPTRSDELLLGVAANHATLGLEDAHVLREQKRAAAELDRTVAARTAELEAANAALHAEIAERQRVAEALRISESLARAQSEVLTRTLDELTMESNFDRIAENVLRALLSQLSSLSCGVWLRNPASGMMDFEFAIEGEDFKSKSDPLLAAVSPSQPMDGVYPWAEIFRTGMPVVHEDIREGPDFPWRSHLLSQGIITVLVVPMFIAGEPAGVIGIRFAERRKFHPGELALARALANQAILAMQLTRLSKKIRQSAVVAERNRLAREVHDTLAQGFTGVIMHLEAAEEAMSRHRAEVVAGHLRGAGEIARDGLREARRSVWALRPLALEEQNLAEALEELIKKLTAGTTLRAKFFLQGEPQKLPAEWDTNVLRIGQEVLTNVFRHAQATELQVMLAFGDREVRLAMCDNGRGFNPADNFPGFGLRGMGERAESMGGQLSIQSATGSGTTVSLVLLLPN